jgi:tRNA A-37 threonylcarbamoyl transferase component Bud32
MTEARFRQPMWIVPLVIAVLVAIFGWWGNVRLRHTIEQQLRAQLNTTLNANATALQIWMVDQKKLAGELSDEPRLRTLAVEILEDRRQAEEEGTSATNVTAVEQFSTYLRPRLYAAGYTQAQLVDTNYTIVANSSMPRRMALGRISDAHTNKFEEVFDTGEPVVITPYKPELSRGFRGRGARAGATNDPERSARLAAMNVARGRRGDITLMQVAAPVRDNDRDVLGALALVIRPDMEFTKILSAAQVGQTGETYAFDQTGLMISESRFDDQLRKAGLLGATNTNTTSALNLRLHDPMGLEVDGTRPLTRIVASAVAGEDGVSVESSRDYRGVEVVGAWRWLPDYEFGVATQIDAEEAFQPLRVLKLLFTILCLLLLLCATGMFLFSYANFRWQRRLTEAELKLKQLGQYTLEEKIGEGGMGVVYFARHALMRRDTAVKLLTPDRADAVAIERFEREVRLTCQLTHPNTIQVYDYGHTPDGIFYYAMEFLRGLNLHELVARYGPQPESRVAFVLAQVCDALSEAHGVGLVHRDIKPANVFLCNRGGVPDWVKVLDFGLVREYGGGAEDEVSTSGGRGLEGTPWFMPPESIKDSTKSEPRSDLYSVGALGYYLLTGRFVFDGQTIAELCEKHLKEIPAAPSQFATHPVSAEMDAIILKCLEKEPGQRPQSALELRDLLQASPHWSEWTAEARLAWWAQYQKETAPKPGETGYGEQTPMDVMVNVDLESRL